MPSVRRAPLALLLAVVALLASASLASAAPLLDGGASDPAGDGAAADIRKVAVVVQDQVLRLAVTYEGAAPPAGARTDVLISAEAVDPLTPEPQRCKPTPGAAITIASDGQTATASLGPATAPIPLTVTRSGPTVFYVLDSPLLVSSFKRGLRTIRTPAVRDPFACIQVDSGGDSAFGTFVYRHVKLSKNLAMDLVLSTLHESFDRSVRDISEDTVMLCPPSLFREEDIVNDGGPVLAATAACRYDYRTSKAYRFGRVLLGIRGGFLFELQHRWYTFPAKTRDCGTRRRGGDGGWSYRTTGPRTINAFATGLPCAVARRYAREGVARRRAGDLPCGTRRTGDSLMVRCGRRESRSISYEVVS